MKAINEDDNIGMVKLIITCHTSTGKVHDFIDKFIAVEKYRTFTYKEGTTIAEYANQLYLLDRRILQVGVTHVINKIQSYLLTSSEGRSRAMPEIDYEDDSLPGLLDDSDSDDDSIPGLKVDSDSDGDTDDALLGDRE